MVFFTLFSVSYAYTIFSFDSIILSFGAIRLYAHTTILCSAFICMYTMNIAELAHKYYLVSVRNITFYYSQSSLTTVTSGFRRDLFGFLLLQRRSHVPNPSKRGVVYAVKNVHQIWGLSRLFFPVCLVRQERLHRPNMLCHRRRDHRHDALDIKLRML